MNCQVTLKVPLPLLTEVERQSRELKRAKDWGDFLLPGAEGQLEGEFLVLKYTTRESFSAGQFAQRAYDYFEHAAELLEGGTPRKYEVHVVVTGTIPPKGTREKLDAPR
jgi:hypothetical protein